MGFGLGCSPLTPAGLFLGTRVPLMIIPYQGGIFQVSGSKRAPRVSRGFAGFLAPTLSRNVFLCGLCWETVTSPALDVLLCGGTPGACTQDLALLQETLNPKRCLLVTAKESPRAHIELRSPQSSDCPSLVLGIWGGGGAWRGFCSLGNAHEWVGRSARASQKLEISPNSPQNSPKLSPKFSPKLPKPPSSLQNSPPTTPQTPHIPRR